MAERYSRLPQAYPGLSEGDPSLDATGAMGQTPQIWEPYTRPVTDVARTMQGPMVSAQPTSGGPVDSIPNPVEAGMAQIPKNWKEAAMMGAMVAAPVLGQAAWRARGVPRATIEALKAGSGDPLNARIAQRDVVYHATSPGGLDGILKSGEITPGGWGGLSGQEGVSVARSFKHKTKGNQPVVLVIDREKMPPNRPFAEQEYGKMRGSPLPEGSEGIIGTKSWYQKHAPGSLDSIERERQRSNPDFEFENRTYNQPIPVSAIKEILVNQNGAKRWGYESDPRLTGPNIQQVAGDIPVREIPSHDALRTDRVRSTYKRLGEQK